MLKEKSASYESPENKPPRVVVIGVGNLLLKDEGIGIHAVKALQEINLPHDVKIVDGGTAPDIIAYTEASAKLIIVDAARAGGEPGTIYRFHPQDLTEENGKIASVHELGVAQNLKLMSLMGNKPGEIVIIGVEPGEIDWGLELSAGLQNKLTEIVNTILGEIGLERNG
jgi:hydrogenase maturation protease